MRGFENEAEVAQLRENELVAQLDALKADSARAGGEEVELRALEREAKSQRELLEAYLSRYREAASRSDRGNLPADARIISEALVPIKPYFPKTLPIVIIAGLSTLLLASIIIMMRELFTGRALKPVDYGRPQAAEPPVQQEAPGPTRYMSQTTLIPPAPTIEAEAARVEPINTDLTGSDAVDDAVADTSVEPAAETVTVFDTENRAGFRTGG